MELIKKSFSSRLKTIANNVSEHNLFLLSSSISYYSALAVAPFMLILLGIASLLGQDRQELIVKHASSTISPQMGEMVKTIFQNVNEGVNIGSLSGIIGIFILLSTASLVFLQFRYSMDVIYGYYDPAARRSTWEVVKERIFSMFVVLVAAILFVASILGTTYIKHFMPETESEMVSGTGIFFSNFVIYMMLFTAVHYFTPTKKPKFIHSVKIALMTSAFFILGNALISYYLESIASSSIYGAAGVLLVFLSWCYYSSFIIFLSVEVFLYLKRIGKVR